MSSKKVVWSSEEMQDKYGEFYARSPRVRLDRRQIPERFWALLPYAEFWGVSDDVTREMLVMAAPLDVQENLKEVVAEFDSSMDEWLAGPEAENPHPSREYIAFSAMRMAAYFV